MVYSQFAKVTASGVSQPDPAHFAADSFEANDIEIGAGLAAQPGLSISYKIPRITAKDYSGPVAVQRPPASSKLSA